MATNTLLTPDMITLEALTVLHANMSFVRNVNQQYDSKFANSGAKIGDTLDIRLPVQYTVLEDSADISGPGVIQDTTERSIPLTIDKRATVPVTFSSEELTLDMDRFSDKVIKPAMSVMASNIEGRFVNDMVRATPNTVGDISTAMEWADLQAARQKMVENLTPDDSKWCVCMDPKGNTQVTAETQTFFNNQQLIGEQYRKGLVAETAGFKFYENTLLGSHTTGARAVPGMDLQAAPADGATVLNVQNSGGGVNVGDIFTIEGLYRVHPETKATTSELMQFVVTVTEGDPDANGLTFYPAINWEATGLQNVDSQPQISDEIIFAETASTVFPMSLAFHKDAYTFATADLRMPSGVDFSARQVMDGISMRIVQDYNVLSDDLICRIDVLYGYTALRPETACRIAHL